MINAISMPIPMIGWVVIIVVKRHIKNLADAYQDNLRDYKDSIPKIFWYNLGILISNGIENKFSSLTAPFEFFNEWKKVESEDDEPKQDLTTFICGICDKKRLLDIFENFILFDESKNETQKIVPRYFQYFGVNRAFQNVVDRKKTKDASASFGIHKVPANHIPWFICHKKPCVNYQAILLL